MRSFASSRLHARAGRGSSPDGARADDRRRQKLCTTTRWSARRRVRQRPCSALEREKRGALATPLLERAASLAGAFEDMSRPLSVERPYSDDALWQGALWPPMRSGSSARPTDRATRLRLFKALATRFPRAS